MPVLEDLRNYLKLYARNFLLLWSASALVLFASIASLGLLAGPVLMGFMTLCQQLQRGEKGSLLTILSHLPRTVPSLIPVAIAFLLILIGVPIYHIPILGLLWFLAFHPLITLGTVLSLGFIIYHDLSVEYALKRTLALILADPIKAWLQSIVYYLIAITGVVISRWLAISILSFVPWVFFFALAVLPFPLAALGLGSLYHSLENQRPAVVLLKKDALRIAVIILLALIVIGFVFQKLEKPKLTLGKKASKSSSLHARSLSRPANERHKTSPTTNVPLPRFQGTLPKGFPKDIPIHPKARVGKGLDYFQFSQGKSLTVFPVDESPAKVFAYYRTILDAEGWVIRAYPQEPLRNIVFRKPDSHGILTVRKDHNKSQVFIRME